MEWREETVKDSRVINAYLKQKRLMELISDQNHSNAIHPDDDEDTRKRKLQEELRRLKRQVGPVVRKTPTSSTSKNASFRAGANSSSSGDKPATASQRKCRVCGQSGHISSNRICPLYRKLDFAASTFSNGDSPTTPHSSLVNKIVIKVGQASQKRPSDSKPATFSNDRPNTAKRPHDDALE